MLLIKLVASHELALFSDKAFRSYNVCDINKFNGQNIGKYKRPDSSATNMHENESWKISQLEPLNQN